LAFWKRESKTQDSERASVGLVVGSREVTAVHCDGEDEQGRPRILAWETIPYANPGDLQNGLTAFVDRHQLHGQQCRCTLHPDDYSLRLVERPTNVPDEDLADATRWLIRDLVEFDVETAEVATLTLPEDASRGRTPQMFVIAARHGSILDLAHVIDGSGLRVLGFEIVESTMLALDERMPEIVGGSAVLRFHPKSNVVTVAHDHHLYLTRNLHVDFSQIEAAAEAAQHAEDPTDHSVMESIDPLLLDVQRSLDYYESEYGQAPVSRLMLLPSLLDPSPLLPALQEALRPIKVETYDIGDSFSFPERPPADLHLVLALAAGSAAGSAATRSDRIGRSLVPAAFRQSQGGFGLASVLRVAAAILLLLGGLYGWGHFQLEREDAALLALENHRDRIVDEIEERTEQAILAARTTDPEAEIEQLEKERNARVSMLRDMTQRTSRSDASFSRLLAGLARQDLDSIWLEHIVFSHGGDAIRLEGRTLAAEDVPEYLRRLGREAGFASRRFRTFQIERANREDASLVFRLATL
ncbi:unnamed protein product, partial [Discosporangium mesarthrocarpum]